VGWAGYLVSWARTAWRWRGGGGGGRKLNEIKTKSFLWYLKLWSTWYSKQLVLIINLIIKLKLEKLKNLKKPFFQPLVTIRVNFYFNQ
jgi:hypothetical protein